MKGLLQGKGWSIFDQDEGLLFVAGCNLYMDTKLTKIFEYFCQNIGECVNEKQLIFFTWPKFEITTIRTIRSVGFNDTDSFLSFSHLYWT